MKFEDEVSRSGDQLCGESFMAGTICSDFEGHDGSHSTVCTDCGNDWYDQSCTCVTYCDDCGTGFDDTDKTAFCQDCRCQTVGCGLYWEHDEPCPELNVTDEEVAEVFSIPIETIKAAKA